MVGESAQVYKGHENILNPNQTAARVLRRKVGKQASDIWRLQRMSEMRFEMREAEAQRGLTKPGDCFWQRLNIFVKTKHLS